MFLNKMVFTGIVQAVYNYSLSENRLILEATPEFAAQLSPGDSVAINGVCLTFVKSSGELCRFDLSEETLAKTAFRNGSQGKANVELALRYGDRLGGHLVTGHVHRTGSIVSLDQNGNLWIESRLTSELVYKGSVAVNGVSLTVAEIAGNRFRVALIPETLARTAPWEIDSQVNLERDMQSLKPVSPMDIALEQAWLGRKTAPPNPWVGAVLVKNGQIIGKGYHKSPGSPHAEPKAIQNALLNISDFSQTCLYVTLEPCSDFPGKRTPSCAAEIVDKKIPEVVIGMLDPDPRVSGKGVDYLRSHGVGVTMLEQIDPKLYQKVQESLREYSYHRRTGQPWVTAKIALTLDNCYVSFSQWITHQQSREKLYEIWRNHQAIILGPDTVQTDDPVLDCSDFNGCENSNHSENFYKSSHKNDNGDSIYKIVIDGSRLSTDRKIFQNPKCYLVTATPQKWEHCSVKTITVKTTTDLREVMEAITSALPDSIMSVLVEGGGKLHQSFFSQELVNELLIFRSSATAGPNGKAWQIPPVQFRLTSQELIQGNTTNSLEKYSVEKTIRVTDTVESAVRTFRNGGGVVVMDDESRENEGDLIFPASTITVEQMTTMINYTTGIICTPMEPKRAKQLNLDPMVKSNQDNHQTAFTVSVDSANATTGVSAHDRWLTVKALASSETRPSDLRRPGHIFPLVARSCLAERQGHTEAALALCKLAEIYPRVAVIGELKNTDGTMMRLADCQKFAGAQGYPIITVEELAKAEPGIEMLAECDLQTEYGEKSWKLQCYHSGEPQRPHKVLIYGDISQGNNIPVRIHSECFTGDVLGSRHCDCGNQLDWSMKYIVSEGRGVLIYPNGQEGRGIGFTEKVKAYRLQSEGMGTYQANLHLGHGLDARCYRDVVEILDCLGVKTVELLSANPEKAAALGDRIIKVIPVLTSVHQHNSQYLKDKSEHFKNAKESP